MSDAVFGHSPGIESDRFVGLLISTGANRP